METVHIFHLGSLCEKEFCNAEEINDLSAHAITTVKLECTKNIAVHQQSNI